MATQHTCILTENQSQTLKDLLDKDSSFKPTEREHAAYSFEKQKLALAYYPKKGKLLIQGAGTDEFIEFFLEPKVTGILNFPEINAPKHENQAEKPRAKNPNELDLEPHFGIDESGKGDFFGPLVIAGVYSDRELGWELAKLGCTDSKLIKSDSKMQELAEKIKRIPGIAYEIVCIGPQRYNEMYADIGNLNRLLAWGHARVIASLHEKVPSCPRSLSDQFAKEWVLKSALSQRNIKIELEQRTKAESDIAVAAASILARARFTSWMAEASKNAGSKLPLGCAPHVVTAGKKFVATYGAERLGEVAKLHFKLTAQVCSLL